MKRLGEVQACLRHFIAIRCVVQGSWVIRKGASMNDSIETGYVASGALALRPAGTSSGPTTDHTVNLAHISQSGRSFRIVLSWTATATRAVAILRGCCDRRPFIQLIKASRYQLSNKVTIDGVKVEWPP